MDPLDILDLTNSRLLALVAAVPEGAWSAATPCADWDVQMLVGHLIATTIAYEELLGGAPASALLERMSNQAGAGAADPNATLVSAVESLRVAFATPTSMTATVQHPIGSMRGSDLLGLRISENTIHAWDLATALGLELGLPDQVLDLVYARLAPQAEVLPKTGLFAAQQRNHGSDESSLDRLLRISGR